MVSNNGIYNVTLAQFFILNNHIVNKDCCFQLLYNFLVTFIPIRKVFCNVLYRKRAFLGYKGVDLLIVGKQDFLVVKNGKF